MLLQFKEVDLAFGVNPLLSKANLQIKSGEKVCLIGRNGSGKSSLIKLISGQYQPDDGEIWRRDNLKIGVLGQQIPPADNKTVFEVVAEGLAQIGSLLNQYQQLTSANDVSKVAQMAQIQQQIEAQNGWRMQTQVEQIIKRLQLPSTKKMNELSGGWRRRVLLAQALVNNPDLLILDEPTNHLDLGAIIWLENTLKSFNGTILVVTHDRTFLQNLANHIILLDRGQITSWHGDYQSLEQHRIEQLAAEETRNALFDKKLAAEEVWIRQGIKARRTRNEGRVRKLEAMRLERSNRIEQLKTAKFALNVGEKSGKQVIVAKNVNFSYAKDAPLIKDFNFLLTRGARIGFLGANGSGKTTLLKLLLGELEPNKGTIKTGTNLQIAYFEQMRGTLNPTKSVIDNLAEGSDYIEINGKNRHVISYLGEFLFTPERMRTPVAALSGGEVARLCLAKLFSRSANLLVLDEPTNDLDIETLELLEQTLLEFSESVLLISHDRSFLDNLVTSTLVFNGDGTISEYVGGFNDWLRQGGNINLLTSEQEFAPENSKANLLDLQQEPKTKPKPSKVKLSYKLQRELSLLPQEITTLEKQIAELNQIISAADFFKQDQNKTSQVLQELTNLQQNHEAKLNRWLELEEMSNA